MEKTSMEEHNRKSEDWKPGESGQGQQGGQSKPDNRPDQKRPQSEQEQQEDQQRKRA
jgi:hypothetical protein